MVKKREHFVAREIIYFNKDKHSMVVNYYL